MDKMYIKDLEIFANHGYFQEEKKLGQKFILSFELDLDLSRAGEEDNLDKTVHYGILCDEIEKEFTRMSHDLIEKAAEEIVNFILLKYEAINKVKLKLKKPWAPVRKHLNYVAIEIERQWHKAYIAVGSNLGDKEKNIKDALEIINNSKHTKINKIANYYNTEPVGYTDQDEFLNTAIEVKTLLTPQNLMKFLLDVEKSLKRERIIKYGPRTLDLDVIFYDDLINSDEEIIIPHPRMEERLFVLNPLCDIAPYKLHPILNKRIIDIRESILKDSNKK
ncbi:MULTISPECIES: 2-amino-4-hydroxy-6-hydroxymethyldihydropteridine diphosphokinase [unclassified Clostridium]|uniref:2-amino-4-hydroxy-6- hydroxymethyldihydropteridine diphosphokinase n=1 Tax=unclassified Clostridium TaxID=2614128 RepID=UPI0025C5DC79|nr:MULTISPECIES: 2-amino-4-hydroxy-6-hydroxymethyldihydropteridine diphosphokinase [unclassified Clostridium]